MCSFIHIDSASVDELLRALAFAGRTVEVLCTMREIKDFINITSKPGKDGISPSWDYGLRLMQSGRQSRILERELWVGFRLGSMAFGRNDRNLAAA